MLFLVFISCRVSARHAVRSRVRLDSPETCRYPQARVSIRDTFELGSAAPLICNHHPTNRPLLLITLKAVRYDVSHP